MRGDERPACLCTPRIAANRPGTWDDQRKRVTPIPGGQVVAGSNPVSPTTKRASDLVFQISESIEHSFDKSKIVTDCHEIARGITARIGDVTTRLSGPPATALAVFVKSTGTGWTIRAMYLCARMFILEVSSNRRTFLSPRKQPDRWIIRRGQHR